MVEDNSKVVNLKRKNPNRNINNAYSLINSPTSIYCIVWAIKNLMMHLSSNAINGNNLTNELKKYYYFQGEAKELIDYDLSHLVHSLMDRSLEDMLENADVSIDNLVDDTLNHFNIIREKQ